jgi:hypothetical protein
MRFERRLGVALDCTGVGMLKRVVVLPDVFMTLDISCLSARCMSSVFRFSFSADDPVHVGCIFVEVWVW